MEEPTKTPKKRAPLPVDAWGAERIVRFVLSGQAPWRAAQKYEVSEAVVNRLVTAYRETGRYRTPQQGKGRTDDERWIYAGPRAAQNLLALEKAFYEDPEHTHISEVRDRHLRQEGCEPGYSTVGKALRDPSLLDITNKRLTGYAKERDAKQCELWEQRMRDTYTADQMICIDETYATRASRACLPAALLPARASHSHTILSLALFLAVTTTTRRATAGTDALTAGTALVAWSCSTRGSATRRWASSRSTA